MISVHISNFQMGSVKGMSLVELEYEQIPTVVAKAHHHVLAGAYH